MVRNSDSAIQRLQVGLVGLLVVLIFVSIANMLSDGAQDGIKSGSAGSTREASVPGQQPVADEPLGEMGVTPVVPEQKDNKAVSPAPAPKS